MTRKYAALPCDGAMVREHGRNGRIAFAVAALGVLVGFGTGLMMPAGDLDSWVFGLVGAVGTPLSMNLIFWGALIGWQETTFARQIRNGEI